jgi:regulator of protease activity HflC (stomatin/prohibitin superfamily)
MGLLTFGVIFFLVLLLACIVLLAKKGHFGMSSKLAWAISAAVIILAVTVSGTCIFNSCSVVLSGHELGAVYPLYGEPYALKPGRNFVIPWLATYDKFDGSVKPFFFVEGEAANDLYGAQTSEGVYLSAGARISVRPDPERLMEYIRTFRANNPTDEYLQGIVKSESKKGIEAAVSPYEIAYVMGHKSEIANTANTKVIEQIQKLPLIVVSFTLDELRGPSGYEESMDKQALLKVQAAEAILLQTKNTEEATANNIKAMGEATVAETNAKRDKNVAQTKADEEKYVKTTNATAAAEVLATETKAKTDAQKLSADASAYSVEASATADANATKKKGDAEASAVSAMGQAYMANPKLMELEIAKLDAGVKTVWGERWIGVDFSGLGAGGLTFTDLTDSFKELISTVVGKLGSSPTVTAPAGQ